MIIDAHNHADWLWRTYDDVIENMNKYNIDVAWLMACERPSSEIYSPELVASNSFGEVKSLEFEICISGHNAFGPVHNKDEDLQWVGPFAYEDFKTGNFDSGYLLKEQGLINLPEVFESVE